MTTAPVSSHRPSRRAELAAFLRSRRGRVAPADVGLAPGIRRRTPGLRREEVAQLAGVGVTWYTWLEQGRPINASTQVLDAVARTLRLDHAEREHLYRLAGVPTVPPTAAVEERPLGPEVQLILDALGPLAAAVYSSRFDLKAWNATYARLFHGFVAEPPERRNVLRQHFTARSCCNLFIDPIADVTPMVAMLRAAFGRHLTDPSWTRFVHGLAAASPEFARMWSAHDVAEPGPRTRVLHYDEVGEVRLTSTSLDLAGTPETRIVVHTPADDRSRDRVTALLAHPPARCSAADCPDHAPRAPAGPY
ncbi:helix-turn-helix transcriptional regulator [Streptomyces uncialis]|uniref:helix-turn-helix transcriptional regulator n=1 Tax=Streptomyces uncialis TaxID=1048205 RepID=UPI003790A0CA